MVTSTDVRKQTDTQVPVCALPPRLQDAAANTPRARREAAAREFLCGTWMVAHGLRQIGVSLLRFLRA